MRCGWRLVPVLAIVGAMAGPMAMAARPKLPVPSTWRLDQMRSDFGGNLRLKSDIFTVTSDTPARLSLSFVTVDAAGQTMKSSWSGPENGSMLPLDGAPGTMFGMDKKGHEHWVFADGSTLDAMMSLSKDKQTVLVRGTLTTRDGKTYQQVLVYGPWN